jgi:2',3'-cyclic-nucleotide 2'-phosphodiesterase (5'-nucleotidase family)
MRSSLNDDEIVAAVYPALGSSACAIGDQELNNGIPFFKNNLNGKLNFVSSNLQFSDKEIKIERYRIIQLTNGIKVGVTAVNYNTDFKYLMRSNVIKESDITVDKAFDNLKKSLSEMKGKSDLIVILANLNNEGIVKLLDNVDGYDLVIGGNNGEEFKYARRIENKIHVQNGRDGEKIGKVEYSFSADKKPKFEDYELIKILAKKHKRNEAVEKIIKGLDK